MTGAGGPAAALADRPLVLDGGLSTELERAGHDISSALWSARLLRDDPAAVVAAHRAFAVAGASVATTASYQATFDGFAAAGLDGRTATRLIADSVRLAREGNAAAGDGRPRWVAGSVGPYGAMLADGSEYRGDYTDPAWPGRTGGGLSVAELRAFHRRRIGVLAGAGADLIAAETVPAAAEAEALVAELAAAGVPGWLSLTTVTGPDGIPRTRRGEPAEQVWNLAAGVEEVVAVGVNCTDPAGVAAAVGVAAAAAGKPVVVYPNSGERWDPVGRRWAGDPDLSAADVASWLAGGARLVGGCCRVGPGQVAALAALVEGAPAGPAASRPGSETTGP